MSPPTQFHLYLPSRPAAPGFEAQVPRTQAVEEPTTSLRLVSLHDLAIDTHLLRLLPPPSPGQTAPATPSVPPPYPSPKPWLWTCHVCNKTYRLSVTSRCLSCSHRCCSLNARTRTGRPRRRAGVCGIMFDIEGWAARGYWRRNFHAVAGTADSSPLTPGEDESRRAHLFDTATHSCEKDCDSPSQCHIVADLRRRAREREEEDRLYESRRLAVRMELAALGMLSHRQEAEGPDTSLSPVVEEFEEASWFSGSSSSSSSRESIASLPTEDMAMDYVEDEEAEAEVQMDRQLEGITGGEDVTPRRLAVIADGRGMPVFGLPVSPESPIENPGDVFLGTGMDSDEWAEEVALMGSIGLTKTSPVSERARSWTELVNEASEGEEDAMEMEGEVVSKDEGVDLIALAKEKRALQFDQLR